MPPDTEEEIIEADSPQFSEADPVANSRQGSDDEAEETFPRAYVEKLRKESARYREQAHNADAHAQRLHTELVRATGRLADPTDLPFDPAHLDDPDAITSAIEELLAKKPHLAARRPMGDIGQGATSSAASVDLAALLRQRA